jgi:Fic family protein
VDIGALTPADRHVEGIVEMTLDATQKHAQPLTAERLFGWHAALFSTGRGGTSKITVAAWRPASAGPMRVVPGVAGRERSHFKAPQPARLAREVRAFLKRFNDNTRSVDPAKAATAHLWFVTIHPFEDGNGRIARAIADQQLARSESSAQRFHSMSAQIRSGRRAYYDILETTQRDGLDITPWLEWFLDCLDRAFSGAQTILGSVLTKAKFWELYAGRSFNDRQRRILNQLLDGFDGKLTSSKWAKLAKCSQDTAGRDIDDLLKRNILVKDAAGGRSTSYSLATLGCSARVWCRHDDHRGRLVVNDRIWSCDSPVRMKRRGPRQRLIACKTPAGVIDATTDTAVLSSGRRL